MPPDLSHRQALGKGIELSAGLYWLPMVYALDGRVASHRADARGFATMNSFVIREPGAALMLDAGLSAHQGEILDALGTIIDPSTTLSIWSVRIQEFASVANVRPIAERFAVDALYASVEDGVSWTDFRPEYAPYGTRTGVGVMGHVACRELRRGGSIPIGARGREVVVIGAPLRMLPLNWAYDAHSKTLFTADVFSYCRRDSPTGPWRLTATKDCPDADEIWTEMVYGRYWWLPGARTSDIRSDLAAVFDMFDVERIAPGYGCVFEGRAVVERQVAILDALLASAPELPSIGLDVGEWRLRETASGRSAR